METSGCDTLQVLLPAENDRAVGGRQGSSGQGPGQFAAQSWPFWGQDAPPAWQLLPRAGHVSCRPLCYQMLRSQTHITFGMRHLHADWRKLFFCLTCRYVRLELLQGVAAFHSGDSKASLHLASALAKWQRLQVSDESLATLASMGFTTSQVGLSHLL